MSKVFINSAQDNDGDYYAEIDSVIESSWSKLLNEFQDSSIYQTWQYGEIIYGKNNISHLILKKRGIVVAIAQVCIKDFPLLKVATASVNWGPIWRKKDEKLDIEHLTQILKMLIKEYSVKRKLLLRIWPNENDDNDLDISRIILSNGFKHNGNDRPYRTFILDITPSTEILRKNLEQKWRNQLNKAEKNNLTITDGCNDSLYQIFLILQKEMIARKNYIPGVDYETYRLINNSLPDNLKMQIFICYHKSQPIAITLCSAIGDCGIYILGATGDKGLKLNGSNLLQWYVIKWLKLKGCRYYDLGGIDPYANPGVYRFKKGVAGKNGKDVRHIGQFVHYNCWRAYLIDYLLRRTIMFRKFLFYFKAKFR